MKLTKTIIKQLIREALANLNRDPAPQRANECSENDDCDVDAGEICKWGKCVQGSDKPTEDEE